MRYLLLSLILLAGDLALAQDEKPQAKKKYTLGNPVPKGEMREMATDRPDVTESAYSVDAGHLQVETDLFKRFRTKDGDTRLVENYFNLANIKLGLTNSTDFQVVINTASNQSETAIVAPNSTTTTVKLSETTFFRDITLRVKHNLWGNDGGKTALSVMPFVNVPIQKDGDIDGGVVFPFAAELPHGWGFGAQSQFELINNEHSNGRHIGLLHSVTAGHELVKNLDIFGEAVHTYDFEFKKGTAYLNSGIIFSVSDNVKFDTGFNAGLPKGSDSNWFIGFSFRY